MEQDIIDYYSLVFDKNNSDPEMKAFFKAWDGSIDFQKSSGNYAMANNAMPGEQLVEALSILLRGA